jgi:predicted nucleic acid-binding Zn ribbon protein
VGAKVAAEARPTREREGTITVECRAATWAQELDLLQDELIAKLNGALAAPRVRRLRLIVGSGVDSDSH